MWGVQLQGALGVPAQRQPPSLGLDRRAGCQVLRPGRRSDIPHGTQVRTPKGSVPGAAAFWELLGASVGHKALARGAPVQTRSWSHIAWGEGEDFVLPAAHPTLPPAAPSSPCASVLGESLNTNGTDRVKQPR